MLPKNYRKILFTALHIVTQNIFIQAQCNSVFSANSISPYMSDYISPPTHIPFYQAAGVRKTGETYTLTVDTLRNFWDTYLALRDENYRIYLGDAPAEGIPQIYLKNLVTHDSLLLGPLTESYGSTIYETDKFLFINLPEPLLINFETGAMKKMDFYPKIIGNDDTSLYFLSAWQYKRPGWKFSFKLHDKKYYAGTLAQLTFDSIKIISPKSRRTASTYNDSLDFYNSDYKTTNTYTGTEFLDCVYVNHYLNTVYYKDRIIYTYPHEQQPISCSYRDDTLKIMQGTITFSYVAGELVQKINVRDSIIQVSNHKNGRLTYAELGDYIIAERNFNISDTSGLTIEAAGLYTVNKLPVPAEALHYSVIYLFDRKTFTFLGYPVVAFESQ